MPKNEGAFLYLPSICYSYLSPNCKLDLRILLISKMTLFSSSADSAGLRWFAAFGFEELGAVSVLSSRTNSELYFLKFSVSQLAAQAFETSEKPTYYN